MRIEIDSNNLLVIENPNIPQVKEYSYNVSGYLFSDYDKGIIVMHKKERKIINLKNLGDTMSVVYVAPRKEINTEFDKEGFVKALCLFDSFDETTGKSYYFLPKFPEREIARMNVALEKIGISTKIEKTEKGVIVQGDIQPSEHRGKYTSFLFGLILLYGKMDIKNGELIAIKAHIPLFGQFLKYEENLNMMKKQLAEEGIFITTSTVKSNDGIIYQISCNDYEVLKNFANYAKSIEKIDKIPKYDQAFEYKKNLLEFISTNPEIPQEGQKEVVERLKAGTMKLLTK